MNGQSTRLLKEARQLMWPTCAIMLTGLLSLIHTSNEPRFGVSELIKLIVPLGLFIGVPLLATLPLGYDFQWHTLSLLLSQPVERAKLWREKQFVAAAAMLPAAALFLYAARSPRVPDPDMLMIAVPWLLAMLSSAIFWTLVSRSTIGGVVLNIAACTLLLDANYLASQVSLVKDNWVAFLWIRAIMFAGYAVLMVWLGRRLFLRYQIEDATAGTDVLSRMAAALLPAAVTDWLRSTPTGAVKNLLRRELHLLRPILPLSLLSALGWTTLVAFDLLPARHTPATHEPSNFAFLLMGVTVMLIPLIGMLAGSLSLGEEKTLGTHGWQVTLPLAPRVQWMMKLSVGVVVGTVCGGVVPCAVLALAGIIKGGGVFLYLEPVASWAWPLGAAVFAILAFWCASAASSTLRAAICVFPFLVALMLTGRAADWAADIILHNVGSPFGDLLSRVDPFALTRSVGRIPFEVLVSIPFAPVVAYLIWQSYRMFRSEIAGSKSYLLRCIAPPMVVAFLASLALAFFLAFVGSAFDQQRVLLREAHEAIETLDPGPAHSSEPHLLHLGTVELARVASISESAKSFLRDSTITVGRDDRSTITQESEHSVTEVVRMEVAASRRVVERTPHDGPILLVSLRSPGPRFSYSANVDLADGRNCFLTYRAAALGYGTLTGRCQ